MDGMSSDAIEGEPSHLGINSIFSPSMPILNVFEPISKPILGPNKSFYAPSTKLHNYPRNPSKYPKNRSHEDYKNTLEEQQQWQECVEHTRNTYVVVKEWMEEDKTLELASKLSLNSNGELKSISLINITHPSLEKALEETNLGDINSWEILENKTSNK